MTDLAWAAGFVDGEGTISLHESNKKDSGSLYAYFSMPNTYHKAIFRFKSIVKVGTIALRTPKNPNSRDITTITACGDDAVCVCRLLLDYLYVKKRQAEIVLEFDKIPITYDESDYEPSVGGGKPFMSDETRIKRLILLDEIRELNKRGK